METVNKNTIVQKLSELIDVTICSPKFLSMFTAQNVFSKIDIEMIEAAVSNNFLLKLSNHLYVYF